MPEELSAQYNPKGIEQKWFELWAATPLLHAVVNRDKKPFCIVIPPPNVTGILHMGHALNNTLQDILIRTRRMQGYEALWMPGTDHAGIATQNVVEREIAKEGKKRQDLGREEFLRRVWEWKKQYGSTIIHQLKKIGATCDWSRERFTMDEDYTAAVTEVFVQLYEKGLIYQGDYIINWCPRCRTALADEEAPHHDLDGKLYYIKYPLKRTEHRVQSAEKGKRHAQSVDHVVVATTRPETMLGDTAVAVNPTDRRFKDLIGATVVLPLVEREIRIIGDTLVDKKFGTGCVKVTPAHDPNDYLMGRSHGLEFINIMHPDGVLNTNAGDYAGMDRFEAREAIIEELRERKLLLKVEDHRHAVGHCYRCHTIIEPYLSEQWFVKMKPLAAAAIEAVRKGHIKFTPKRWTKVYLNWMENIKDWCISRQIWWGHRLPVYYCNHCLDHTGRKSQINLNDQNQKIKQKGIIVSRTRPEKCPHCGNADLKQDEDVLDTWFSSWLWPFATFGWPFKGDNQTRINDQMEELDYFYPTSVLVTAPEIIFFWVARMIMAGCAFLQKIPFSDVVIHGTVRDAEGKKMSKSLGNSIDPLGVVDQYGADALRFSLVATAASGSDIYLSRERFEQGRNFANKVWNASRFILMNMKEEASGERLILPQDLQVQDRWILNELNECLRKVNKGIDAFKFNEALNTIYEFFWHKFCDWYLEIAKKDIASPATQAVLAHVLKNSLLVLHPFMPFITAEITGRLPFQKGAEATLALTPWPSVDKDLDDKPAAGALSLAFDCILHLRERSHSLKLPSGTRLHVHVWAGKNISPVVESVIPVIKHLASVEDLVLLELDRPPKNSLSILVSRDLHLYLLLEGLVDIEKERERLRGEAEALKGQEKQKSALLKNKNFIKKAPAQVVEAEKKKLQELRGLLSRIKEVRDGLK